MGDPKGRKEYGSPDETYIDDKGNIRKKKCWFCEKGCAISSMLHLLKLPPNEENIRKYTDSNVMQIGRQAVLKKEKKSLKMIVSDK